MALLVVGLNHKTSPVAVRERLVFAGQTLEAPLTQWHDPAVEEVVILSTCNRVDAICRGLMPRRGHAVVSIFWRPIMGCQRLSLFLTCTSGTTSRRCGISFGLPLAWIRWCLTSRRSSDR